MKVYPEAGINKSVGKYFFKRIVNVLIFLIVFQAWSFLELGQSCGFAQEGLHRVLAQVISYVSPKEVHASVATVFGPKKYIRTTGKPNVYIDTFSATPGAAKLSILNGDETGTNRVSSAIISVNGIQMFGTNDFNQNVYNLEKSINLSQLNTIKVELRSKPKSYLRIEIAVAISNSFPTAHAGPDQTVYVTQTVTLDGSASSDVDGDPLTYFWSFTSLPAGSTAALSDPTALNPSFYIDKPGTYVVQLIVNDGAVDSAPDTVTISTENSRPVANSGPDQTVYVTQTVTLDGSASSDVDGDPLTYFWSFTTIPTGSSAVISDPASVNPSFAADVAGTYVAQLIVNDGFVDSLPDTVTVNVSFGLPTVSIMATDSMAGEPGFSLLGTGTFTFTRSGGNQAEALVVNYTISGTAENGTDYQTIGTSITFPANETSATVTITPLPDNLVEQVGGDFETVILTIQSTPNYLVFPDPRSATVNIQDSP
jgi:hypothetical protein